MLYKQNTALCVLTVLPVDLVLGDDDLAGVGVVGVFDWVAEDAYHTDHLARLAHAVLDVAGVTDELLTTSHLHPWGGDKPKQRWIWVTRSQNPTMMWSF